MVLLSARLQARLKAGLQTRSHAQNSRDAFQFRLADRNRRLLIRRGPGFVSIFVFLPGVRSNYPQPDGRVLAVKPIAAFVSGW